MVVCFPLNAVNFATVAKKTVKVQLSRIHGDIGYKKSFASRAVVLLAGSVLSDVEQVQRRDCFRGCLGQMQ